MQKEMDDIASETRERENERHDDGVILSDLRYSMIGLDETLAQGKKKPNPPAKNEDLKAIMKRLFDKIKALVEAVDSLQKSFKPKSKPQRSYASYVKYNIPPRHIRVGAVEEIEMEDNSDPELDIIDSKIPSREEIKSKSERFYMQALLRRGLK